MKVSINDLYEGPSGQMVLESNCAPLRILSSRTGKVLINDARKSIGKMRELKVWGISPVIVTEKRSAFARARLEAWASEEDYKALKET